MTDERGTGMNARLVLKSGYAVIVAEDGTETEVRSITEAYGKAFALGLRITSTTHEV